MKAFKEIVKDLSTQYGVPEEVVEAILCDWVRILYFTTTGNDPKDDYLHLR